MSEETLVSTFTILRRRLRSIATHLMPHGDDAEDALQEAFCRLWQRRDTINSTREAEALAATTLRNICIDSHRKKKIETVPIDEQHDREEDDDSDSREELIEEVAKLRRKCGLPENFKSWSLAPEDFPFVVKNCRSGSMKSNPREFSDEDVVLFLEKLV